MASGSGTCEPDVDIRPGGADYGEPYVGADSDDYWTPPPEEKDMGRLKTEIRIHDPITVMGETVRVINRDTVELDEDGELVRFVERERIGEAKHPITARDVEADLDRYGKLAAWR